VKGEIFAMQAPSFNNSMSNNALARSFENFAGASSPTPKWPAHF
jgi:hypothetical protein